MSQRFWYVVNLVIGLTLGLLLGIFGARHLISEIRKESVATLPAQPPAPPPPKCLKEKRMHIYGTYQWHTSNNAGSNWGDAPIDLTAVECLEWAP